jgi:hypothetical protein
MLTPSQLAVKTNCLYTAIKAARATTDIKQVEVIEDDMIELGFQIVSSTLQAIHTIASSLDELARQADVRNHGAT